jgi:hypothetical protein
MFQQKSCHLQGGFSRELQELFTSKYTVWLQIKNCLEHTYVMVIIYRCKCKTFRVKNDKTLYPCASSSYKYYTFKAQIYKVIHIVHMERY